MVLVPQWGQRCGMEMENVATASASPCSSIGEGGGVKGDKNEKNGSRDKINGAKEYREWRERQRVPVEIKEKAKVR